MSKRKKNKKKTPKQMEQLRKKQREMMARTTEKYKKIQIERIKEEKERYSKTSTKDFEKWNFDFWNQNGALEIDFTSNKKIKMFFDEFSLRTDMEYKTKGKVHSFTNEYGIVMFSNEGDLGQYNRGWDWRREDYFTCDDTLLLEWIVSDPSNRKKGWGTEIMETMVELSKKYDISISLFACDTDLESIDRKDTRHSLSISKFLNGNGLSRYELINWYKSFGFEIDPRLHKKVKMSYSYKRPFNEYNDGTNDSYMMFPSGSVKETIKFPSIKGYSGEGFNYSSTIDCMDKIVYGN